MTEIIQRKLNDSAWVRWTALILIALTMFFGYMFVDMMSPLQSMIEAQRGWTPDVFGMYGSSEFIFNVFGFLILAGIILDKMGVRFTGMLSASLMFIGACIKYYGVSDAFIGTGAEAWLNSWWVSFPASAKLASLGFMTATRFRSSRRFCIASKPTSSGGRIGEAGDSFGGGRSCTYSSRLKSSRQIKTMFTKETIMLPSIL